MISRRSWRRSGAAATPPAGRTASWASPAYLPRSSTTPARRSRRSRSRRLRRAARPNSWRLGRLPSCRPRAGSPTCSATGWTRWRAEPPRSRVGSQAALELERGSKLLSDARRRVHVSVDIGGTFTDVVAVDVATGRYEIAKASTTAADLVCGVRAGTEAALAALGASPGDVA